MYKKLGRYKQEAKVNFDKKSIRIIGTFMECDCEQLE
jgi:hypothetical protein